MEDTSLAESLLLAAVPPLFAPTRDVVAGERTYAPPTEDGLAASIGFGGADMNGALTIFGVPASLRVFASVVFDLEAEDDALLADMVGELANMLLGRYRNALLREGVEVLSATPVTTRGKDLRVGHGRRKAQRSWYAFRDESGHALWITLDVAFREGFVFGGPDQDAASLAPQEDELVLF